MESEELWMELHVQHQHGWVVNAVARHFNLNRRMVRRQLAAEQPKRYPERALRHPLRAITPFTPAQLAHIARRLAVCPVIGGTDLHGEVRSEYGYAGTSRSTRRRGRGRDQRA